MNDCTPETVESQWAKLGVLFNVAPAARTPDIERLLLSSVRELGANPRLFPVVVTWLVEFGSFVAKHRLKRLVAGELEAEHRPAMGLILESAVGLGAPGDLALAAAECWPAREPGPLFPDYRGDTALRQIAERHASELSKKWGVWAPEVELKLDAIRPASWILAQNPGYRERVIRKGDLRCSILETLRIDAGGRARSESELTRLSGATRTAVRKALAALVLEGEVRVERPPGNERDHAVVLISSAA